MNARHIAKNHEETEVLLATHAMQDSFALMPDTAKRNRCGPWPKKGDGDAMMQLAVSISRSPTLPFVAGNLLF